LELTLTDLDSRSGQPSAFDAPIELDMPEGPAVGPLRIAMLSYRSDPKVGGQGIFLTQVAAALLRRGHRVDILSGPPYPHVPAGARLVEIPSLDLYAQPYNGRYALRWHHLKSWTDTVEYFGHLSGKFVEPYTFGRRVARHLRDHAGAYDVVLDNQSLSSGLIDVQRGGLPIVAVIHHPVHRDRELALAAEPRWKIRWLIKRWWSFIPMQEKVARAIGRIIAVSHASAKDIATCFAIPESAIRVVPLGIDRSVFRPRPDVARHPARLVSTASADVPLKGLRYLLEAYATLLRSHPALELVLVGKLREGTEKLLHKLDLEGRVRFVSDLTGDEMAALYASATVCVTPSLYEGFGLPAAEAMSCGSPVIVTDGGALPEVVGQAGVVVPRADAPALAAAIAALLDDPERQVRLGAAALARADAQFDWDRVGAAYEAILRESITTC
jgi:glycosyltransferase involved in cell wall biosynthesis